MLISCLRHWRIVMEQKNLEELTAEASGKLVDSIAIIDILSDMFDGSYKEDTVLIILKNNVESAFRLIEQSRSLISFK